MNPTNTNTPAKSKGLNWGKSIVLAFALFISFILYFVIKVQSDSKYDNELVVEEYYKHDLHFEDEMTRVQNAHDLVEKPVITVLEKGIEIRFPEKYNADAIKGSVSLYRPSNKKFDFKVPIQLTNSSILIPKNKLIGGRWDVNMEWNYNKKYYLTQEIVYIK